MRRLLALSGILILLVSGLVPIPVSADGGVVATLVQEGELSLTEYPTYYAVRDGSFIYSLYKDSAGYNLIKDLEANVLVYNERFILERLDGTKWKQVGIPQRIDYTESKDLISVTRYYTDFLGTDFEVVYDFRLFQDVKVTINIHSGETAEYRLSWLPSGITSDYKTTTVAAVEFEGVTFDWDDVPSNVKLTTTSEVSDSTLGKKLDLVMPLGTIKSGETLVIDPSVVGTTTRVDIRPVYSRSFYAEGRHWVFYYDGLDTAFTSSTDGETWEDPTIFADAYRGNWDIYYDGNYIHYAGREDPDDDLYYRGGEPNADGTITWSADITEIRDATNLTYVLVGVSTDGYPFVVAYDNNSLYAYKSSDNDGTWTTAVGFPDTLGASYIPSSIVPLSGGDMYVVSVNINSLKGFYWDESADSWDTVETITATAAVANYLVKAVSFPADDEIVVIFGDQDEDIRYIDYIAGSWDNEEVIYAGTASLLTGAISKINDAGDIVVFWVGDPTAGHAYYIAREDSVWDASPTDWFTDATGMVAVYYVGSDSNNTYAEEIGFIYLQDTYPYNIMYDFLSYAPAIVAPTVVTAAADTITSSSAKLYGEVTANGGSVVTTVGFEWDTDSGAPYTNSYSESYVADTFNRAVSSLPPDTTIYWRAYATNTAGTGYSEERSFDTLLPLPSIPTDFTFTETGISTGTLDWTTGTYSTSTVIRGKEGSRPTSITDGYEIYSGALETVDLTDLSLELSDYYFSAWSHNEIGYSTEYAETTAGGSMSSIILLLGLIFVSIALTFLAVRVRHILFRFLAALVWLALLVTTLTQPEYFNLPDMSDPLTQLLCFVFVIGVVCSLVLQIGTDIEHERSVRKHGVDRGSIRWGSYGRAPGVSVPNSHQRYTERREDLRRRLDAQTGLPRRRKSRRLPI